MLKKSENFNIGSDWQNRLKLNLTSFLPMIKLEQALLDAQLRY